MQYDTIALESLTKVNWNQCLSSILGLKARYNHVQRCSTHTILFLFSITTRQHDSRRYTYNVLRRSVLHAVGQACSVGSGIDLVHKAEIHLRNFLRFLYDPIRRTGF